MQNKKRNWKLWVKAAAVRAVKTTAQAALGAMAGATMFIQIDINVVISTALFAGFASIITSLAGLPEVSGALCKEGE